jgi:hypothetical protein
VLAASVPSTAEAHVKWFAAYNVATPPRPLAEVASPTFFILALLSLLVLWAFCRIERTSIGTALLESLDELTQPFRDRIDDLFRAGVAAFFIAIWVHGGIILTPELVIDLPFLPWLQAAIAVALFWRATMVLSAVGIVALFAVGIGAYGTFHMMDYPIFLGAAGYLALSGLGQQRFLGFRPLDVARVGAAVTLLWASVEKWAYPQSSFPVLEAHVGLRMGLSSDFYMVAAGAIEFALAFGLLWTPLVRRLSALALSAMFISAVLEFGKVDAIGHLVIIVILAAILIDAPPRVRQSSALVPASFAATLAVFILSYYGAHAVLFQDPTTSFAHLQPTISMSAPLPSSQQTGLQ